MKRYHTKLECQASYDEHQAKHQHLLLKCARSNLLEYGSDIERAGSAIQHGQAIEQEAAGQRAKHEIFHRRFGRGRIIAAQRYECVAGKRE